MAVAFDAKATTDTAGNTSFTSPQVINNLTIGVNGSVLVGFVALGATGTLPICTGATWNGVALTQIMTKTASDNSTIVYLFGLVSPATGNHTFSVSFSGSTANAGVYIDCCSFTGTDISSIINCIPASNIITDATTPSGTVYPTTALSVTTVNGDMACGIMDCAQQTFSTAASGTLIRNDQVIFGNYSSLYKAAVGSSTTVQFASGASGSPACCIAFNMVQPISAATNLMPQIWM